MADSEVRIDSIAAGGDGVGRVEGRVVFVPRSAPGDVGLVDMPTTGRFARTVFSELRAASPVRTQPPCAHYVRDRCGGCQLQHVTYEAQLAAKAQIVRDAMQRIGKRAIDTPVVHASPRLWRYRRKLTLALRRRGEGWVAGLHPFDEPGRVFPLVDCPITQEEVLAIWRDVMAASGYLPAERELRGAVRIDDSAAASFTLEGGRTWAASAKFFEAVPRITALWWAPDRGARRQLYSRQAVSQPGASFAQVNPAVAVALRDRVVALTLSRSPETVVDAYAGMGDTAIALAKRGVSVTAIELDADAAAWSGAHLPPGSQSIAGRVEDALGPALPADAVILNPPRAGVDRRVTDILESARPATNALIYVSCDPATLARDAQRLAEHLALRAVRCFDMFPQTTHVETVAEFECTTT